MTESAGPIPAVSVVIVNFRTAGLAARCAASVDDATAEVLVVDNSSQDGSVTDLRTRGLRVLERQGNDGFAAAVNDGVRHTRGRVVLVLNADTELRPGAMAAMVDHLARHPDVAVAAPVLRAPDGRRIAAAYRRFPGPGVLFLELCAPLGYLVDRHPAIDPYRMRPADWRAGRPVAHVQGAAMAIRRQAWEASGGLDKRYFLYLEETEWQARLRQLGWKVEVIPTAEVMHVGRSGQPAAAPAVHFLRSAELYLCDRGMPRRVVVVLMATAVTISRVTLRLLSVLPRRGAGVRNVARLWDELWREWWPPRRDPASEAARPRR